MLAVFGTVDSCQHCRIVCPFLAADTLILRGLAADNSAPDENNGQAARKGRTVLRFILRM